MYNSKCTYSLQSYASMLSSAMYVMMPSARDVQDELISISTWSTMPVKELSQSKQCTGKIIRVKYSGEDMK